MACAATDQEIPCKVDYSSINGVWFFWVPFASMDLPLSVIGDTLFLPYTLFTDGPA